METPPYQYELYKSDNSKQLLDNLNKYGVAILPCVLDEKECREMFDGMIADVEHITKGLEVPFKWEDQSTWKTWFELAPNHSMLQQHWKLGHCQTIWNIRQNPKIIKPFEDIWKVDKSDLLCSFDAISIHFPPEITNRGWHQNTWFHTDQSFMRHEFECVQSWVTAKEVHHGDGTLTYLRGSHMYHENIQKKFNILDKKDWYKLTPEMVHYYVNELDCPQECIKCPAGSMVLWDSRLIHCGREPTKGRSMQNMRCVSYICMTPRSKSTPANLKKKQKAFTELRLTTHWPHKPILFGKYPRLYGNPIPKVNEITPPILNNIGKRLAGFE